MDEAQGACGSHAPGAAGNDLRRTYVSGALRTYLDFITFLFGTTIGSFLNVCIYRLPREQSIVSPPSHCPHCGQPIGWRDNIPLLSYVVLRGRCRQCRAPISPRYFLVELLTGTLFLLVVLKYGWQWIVPIYWLLLGGLIAATFIDFEHLIIPNELTYGGVLAGLALSGLYPALQSPDFLTSWILRRTHGGMPLWSVGVARSFVGMLVGGLTLFLVAELGKFFLGKLKVPLSPGTTVTIATNTILVGEDRMSWEEIFSRESDRIRFQAATLKFQDKVFENVTVSVSEVAIEVNGASFRLAEIGPIEATTDLLIIPREAMGLGDAKLLAAIGAFLGPTAALFSVLASSVTGGAVSVGLILARKKDWQSRIPYGPYIALGAGIWIFYGQELVDWYGNLYK
jgi:leader peptidase (prepilin peptidase) / N-methyltransferase